MEHEFLLETDEFTEVLGSIGEIISEDFSEDEVQMVFLNEGYFQLLGYEKVGTDLRSEYSVPSGFVDYITSGHGDTFRDMRTVVYEFKKPGKRLSRYKEQLADYMGDTGAKYGVLTNGLEFWLYQQTPTTPEKMIDFELESAENKHASLIILALGYWSIEEQNLKPVAERAAKEVVNRIPEELYLQFSKAGVELFAKHLTRYLQQEFRERN
jgi:hypothetical protein